MTPPAWTPAYIGLGSNLQDPVQQLELGIAALRGLPQTRLVAVSGYYRNPPFGPVVQPDFINAAAGLLTQLPSGELLAMLKAIERRHGREPGVGPRWGPRVLDLDLLVHGAQQLSQPGLELPHPGIAERNFVLFPLLEIAPGLIVPGLGPVGGLASRVDARGLQRLDGADHPAHLPTRPDT